MQWFNPFKKASRASDLPSTISKTVLLCSLTSVKSDTVHLVWLVKLEGIVLICSIWNHFFPNTLNLGTHGQVCDDTKNIFLVIKDFNMLYISNATLMKCHDRSHNFEVQCQPYISSICPLFHRIACLCILNFSARPFSFKCLSLSGGCYISPVNVLGLQWHTCNR